MVESVESILEAVAGYLPAMLPMGVRGSHTHGDLRIVRWRLATFPSGARLAMWHYRGVLHHDPSRFVDSAVLGMRPTSGLKTVHFVPIRLAADPAFYDLTPGDLAALHEGNFW